MALGTITFAQTAGQTAARPAQTPAADAAKSKTLTALQGTWVITTANGNDMAGQPEMTVTFTGDKYVQTAGGNIVERGTMKFDDTKKPIHMDVAIAEGDDAGKTQLGLLEFTSPTSVRGKVNGPGVTTRPSDFEVTEGGFSFIAVKKK